MFIPAKKLYRLIYDDSPQILVEKQTIQYRNRIFLKKYNYFVSIIQSTVPQHSYFTFIDPIAQYFQYNQAMFAYFSNLNKLMFNNNIQKIQKMTNIFTKAFDLLFKSFDQTALIEGVSDIIVVKWQNGHYNSTPILACFGHYISQAAQTVLKVSVNDREVTGVNFTLDSHGYIHPMKPSAEVIKKFGLESGKNQIKFQLVDVCTLCSQIYLYEETDTLLISDMDGTLTKNDVGGFISNFSGEKYLHDGYDQLVSAAAKNGHHIVWLTMRSMPLYNFSKSYIRSHTSVHGALLTEPQEFLPAFKKQITKQTGNIKTNMMLTIKKLFPSYRNPFVGGLGNRENDAIAYRAAGIELNGIFIVDTSSTVHHLQCSTQSISYIHMAENINHYFPKSKSKKTRQLKSLQTMTDSTETQSNVELINSV